MKNTFSILFYIRKSKQKADGTTPIYVRVTVNGKRSDFSSKRSIDASKWNKSKARAKGTNENTRTLNTYLDTLKQKLYDSHQHLLNKGKVVSAKALTNHYLDKSEEKQTLLEVFKLHNDNITSLIGRGYAKSTVTKYKTTYKHLKAFIKHKYKTDDLHLIQLSLSTITAFEYYLKTVQSVGVNCSNKYLTHFNKVVNLAVDNEWLDKNPCLNHKMKNKEVVKEFLTENEIDLLLQKELPIKRLDQVRDIFAFCCLTGLAFVDVAKLRPNDLHTGIDGKPWIHIRRQKTNSASHIPLFPHAISLIEKYENHPEAVNKGTVLPVLSNQKMNAYLKEIALLCNISKNLTMHTARHTFATYTLTKGVPIETVSKLLGHKSLETTQIYAKIIDKKVADDLRSLMDSAPFSVQLAS